MRFTNVCCDTYTYFDGKYFNDQPIAKGSPYFIPCFGEHSAILSY